MAVDFWDNAVESYLCTNRGLFLHPDRPTREAGEARPDFLAIDFPGDEAWLVEVATARGEGLAERLGRFEEGQAPAIRARLEEHRVVRGPDPWADWTLGVWVFAPRSSLAALKARAAEAGVRHCAFTPLEEVIVTIAPLDFGDRHARKHA